MRRGTPRPGAWKRPLGLPPGARLRKISRFLYPPKTFARVFEPVLDDLLHEYQDALFRGEEGRARWVVLRGRTFFWLHLCRHLLEVIAAPLRTVLKIQG